MKTKQENDQTRVLYVSVQQVEKGILNNNNNNIKYLKLKFY